MITIFTLCSTTSIVLDFIQNASNKHNDRIIRILAVSRAYSVSDDHGTWIEQRREQRTLHQVTYKEIRSHSNNPKMANLATALFNGWCALPREFKEELESIRWENWEYVLVDLTAYILIFVFMVFTLPIYLLSRIVSILFPYFIVVYVSYNGLWTRMELFELVMLGSYIGLQMLVLLLGVSVFRTHWALWHVLPGMSKEQHSWTENELQPFVQRMHSFYEITSWIPTAKEIVIDEMGLHIGAIVMEYVESMCDADLCPETV